MYVKVLTANIKDNPDMPDAHVRYDLRKIYSWLMKNRLRRGRIHFAGFQEIGEQADHRAINAAFNLAKGYRQFFLHRQTPIVVRTVLWQVVDRYWIRTHAGLAGISPSRGYSVTLNQHRVWRSKKLAFIDSHFVSAAWYGDHARQTWRREKWIEHFDEMREHIKTLNSNGWTVIVLADWNRHEKDVPEITPTTFLAATNGYYDHIYVCPSSNGIKLKKVSSDVCREFLHTDHNPVFAKLKVV